MPLSDATISAIPTPPKTGIYGGELAPYSDNTLKEKTPDGGAIIWELDNTPHGKDWMPTRYVKPSKKIQA